MNHARPPVIAAPAPRSTFVTALAWIVIVLSALLLPISFVSCLMLAARSHGTSSADPIGFLIVVLGPLTTLVAGIGLLRRRRWALIYLAMVLCGIVIANAFHLARNPSAPKTYVSRGGVPTTVIPAGQTYVIEKWVLIAISAVLLMTLLSRKVRAEFDFGNSPLTTSSATSAASSSAGIPPLFGAGTVIQSPPGGALTGSPQPPPAMLSDRERGWRVGHLGRDCMFYEEWREGAWQRIEISGEMLMGRAHHVIYFASPQRWLEYPEWARHRRDEIIARIKSEFRAPDYEYDGDGAQTLPMPPAGTTPKAVPPRPTNHSVAAFRPGHLKSAAALWVTVAALLVATAGLGWLAGSGLSAGKVLFPSKRATERRVVTRLDEPVTFWISLGLYSTLGVGTLGAAIWLLRESFRQRPN